MTLARRDRRERTGEREQPHAHRGEGHRLVCRERDDAAQQQRHPDGEQDDDTDREAAEPARDGPAADRRCSERDEREDESAGGDIVQDGCHRDRDEADERQVTARRSHRDAQPASPHAAHRARQVGADDSAVRGEDDSGREHRRVERAAREVLVRAELREVQSPPGGVGGRHDRDEDAGREDGRGDRPEAVRSSGGCGACRGCGARAPRAVDGYGGREREGGRARGRTEGAYRCRSVVGRKDREAHRSPGEVAATLCVGLSVPPQKRTRRRECRRWRTRLPSLTVLTDYTRVLGGGRAWEPYSMNVLLRACVSRETARAAASA